MGRACTSILVSNSRTVVEILKMGLTVAAAPTFWIYSLLQSNIAFSRHVAYQLIEMYAGSRWP